ncbi:hypothetical protein PIB30_000413 [Stylosanthes scabra]|uniref:Uncharacterized protein n=1 Tax=Stylosanthes scabra TaxID=79078 RepID=A0ABU6V135_9FABA|nr:hypothetical protein [Stylosanthes scabra]
MEKRAINNEENEETDDIENDAEESFTCEDEEDEDIEEAKNTLQACEKDEFTFNEDEDALLAKMTNKKKNNGKRRHKKMHLQAGLKLSKRLLMPVGRVRPSEDFVDELFKDQSTRTRKEHFSFHKNLQYSSDLRGTTERGWTCKATPTLKSDRENTLAVL